MKVHAPQSISFSVLPPKQYIFIFKYTLQQRNHGCTPNPVRSVHKNDKSVHFQAYIKLYTSNTESPNTYAFPLLTACCLLECLELDTSIEVLRQWFYLIEPLDKILDSWTPFCDGYFRQVQGHLSDVIHRRNLQMENEK